MTRYLRAFFDALGFLVFPSLKKLRDSKAALASLAKHFQSRVRPASGDLKQDGYLFAELRIRLEAMRAIVYATDSRVVFECSFPSSQQLHFSVNEKSWTQPDGRLHRQVAGHSLYVYFSEQPTLLDQWLADPSHESLLKNLDLGSGERLDLFSSGLWVSVHPTHATPAFVDGLIAFFHSLPPEMPENHLEGIDQLPENLQPLGKWFEHWSIGDDEQRSQKLRKARKTELAQLKADVAPLLPDINAYLYQLGDSPWPKAALKLSTLAQMVAEIQASIRLT